MQIPSAGRSGNANMPALVIRVRPFDVDLPCPDDRVVMAPALLDTGATVSSIPMWSLDQLGIEADEESRRAVFGAQGDFHAYAIKIGIEIEHNMGWFDIGVVNALVPDTARSRDPEFHLPFLLGRKGFSTSSTHALASPSGLCGSAGQAGGRRAARRRDDVAACGPRPSPASAPVEDAAPAAAASRLRCAAEPGATEPDAPCLSLPSAARGRDGGRARAEGAPARPAANGAAGEASCAWLRRPGKGARSPYRAKDRPGRSPAARACRGNSERPARSLGGRPRLCRCMAR